MHVDVTLRGPVPKELASLARDEVAALDRLVKGPVMRARAVTGRGCVLYLRYDGHYGIIEPDGAATA
jgi:hypothetical protein